jgi:hypothetical protein
MVDTREVARSSVDSESRRDLAHGDAFELHTSKLGPVMYGLAVFSTLLELPGYHSSGVNERIQLRIANPADDYLIELGEQIPEQI